MRSRWMWCLAAVAVWASPAPAAPLAPEHVAGDAKWYLHLDVDEHKQSAFGKQLHEKYKVWFNLADAFGGVIEQKIGMNPMRDLLDITVYGSKYAKRTGVAAVHVAKDKWNAEAAAKLVAKKPDYAKSKHDDVDIHTWTEHQGKPWQHTVAAASLKLADGSLALLFSSTVDELKDGIDVALKKRGSLKDAAAQTGGTVRVPDKGTVLFVRAVALDSLPERCPLRRIGASSYELQTGSKDGKLAGHVQIGVAKENATPLKDVMEGFRAMGLLATTKIPEIRGLLEKKVQIQGGPDSVKWAWQDISGDELFAAVAAAKKHCEEWRKAHPGHHHGPWGKGGCPFCKDGDKKDEGKESSSTPKK